MALTVHDNQGVRGSHGGAKPQPGNPARVGTTTQDVTSAAQSPLLSETLLAVIPVLDAASRNEVGHALKGAVAGMRIATLLDLGQLARADIFYALLLRDLGVAGARAQLFHYYGVLSEAHARTLEQADLSDLKNTGPILLAVLRSGASVGQKVHNLGDLLLGSRRRPVSVERVRSRIGVKVALKMGFSHGTAAAIRNKNERWDGRGRPDGLAGDTIPTGSRILAVSEEIASLSATHSPHELVEALNRESGTRFDPVIVSLAERLILREDLLDVLASGDLESQLLELEPPQRRLVAVASRVDRILEGIAQLIDSQSSWKVKHSERVRDFAVGAALHLGAPYLLSVDGRRRLARMALLHDLVRMGAPIKKIDADRFLTAEERGELNGDNSLVERVVPRTLELADRALITETFVLAEAATTHDSRPAALDRTLENDLSVALICLADKFEALIAERPQRAGLSPEEALAIITQEVEDAAAATGGDELDNSDPATLEAVALTALERFLKSPAAAHLLATRKFDADAIVVA